MGQLKDNSLLYALIGKAPSSNRYAYYAYYGSQTNNQAILLLHVCSWDIESDWVIVYVRVYMYYEYLSMIISFDAYLIRICEISLIIIMF